MKPSPLVGEPLALDLINTTPKLPTGTVDLLGDAAGLGVWLEAEGDRLELPRFRPTDQDAERTRRLRAHVASAVDHSRQGRRPPREDLRAITEAVAAAPVQVDLDWDGTTVVRALRRHGAPGDVLLADLGQAAVDLLTSPKFTSIRTCAHEDCVMLFLPTHPSRQWCSPSRCGNRARVARYYQRHRADASE